MLAYERISSSVKEDSIVTVESTFKGAFMGSPVFEFELLDGSTEKGPIDEDVDDDTLVRFDKEFINKRVTAVFNLVVVKQLRGAEKKSYTLLDIKK